MLRLLPMLTGGLLLAACLPVGGGGGFPIGGFPIGGFPIGGLGTGRGWNDSVYDSGSRVRCDRRTEVCYKDGEIDASETKDAFGKNAARRVDRIRDQAGTNDIFLPRGNTVCNRDDKVCYKNGKADWSDTRDQFGKKAARKVKK